MRIHEKGFTLIELMVVVAIIAILASIAVPSYTSYLEKSRRMEARESLYRVVNAMEKFMLANNTYPASIDLLANGDADNTSVSGHGLRNSGGDWMTEDGHYIVTVSNDAAGWRVQATANPSSPQTRDATCRTFQLFLDGRQSASDVGGSDKTGECWPG